MRWIGMVLLALVSVQAPSLASAQGDNMRFAYCQAELRKSLHLTPMFRTHLKRDELNKQFYEYLLKLWGKPSVAATCFDFENEVDAQKSRTWMGKMSPLREQMGFILGPGVNWTPDEQRSEGAATETRKKSVFFRAPRSDESRGYQGVTFDIEYQLIACMGELHLAYSLVEGSVRGKRPAYLFQGPGEESASWHEVAPAPPQVDSVQLSGTVFDPVLKEKIGEFSDNFAGPALGFGCFSGQTKKIANLKDHVGENPTKEKVQAFIDKLDVSFRTRDLLTSQSAEAEIRAGDSKKVAAPKPGTGDANAGPSDAELRAQRRAKEEAEFQAAMKKYEEELAKQQQAVAEFNAANEQLAADKAAQAQRAQAAQAEFDRQKAAHEAEMERYRQQQAEYEAQLNGSSPQ